MKLTALNADGKPLAYQQITVKVKDGAPISTITDAKGKFTLDKAYEGAQVGLASFQEKEKTQWVEARTGAELSMPKGKGKATASEHPTMNWTKAAGRFLKDVDPSNPPHEEQDKKYTGPSYAMSWNQMADSFNNDVAPRGRTHR